MLRPPKEFEEYVERVLKNTAAHFGCWHLQIMNGSKERHLSRPRAVALAVLRRTGTSYPRLASLWRLHHTSILYFCRNVDDAVVDKIEAQSAPKPKAWGEWQMRPSVRCPNCHDRSHMESMTNGHAEFRCTACGKEYIRAKGKKVALHEKVLCVDGGGNGNLEAVLPDRGQGSAAEAATPQRCSNRKPRWAFEAKDGGWITTAEGKLATEDEHGPSSPRNPGAGGGYIPGSIGCFAG